MYSSPYFLFTKKYWSSWKKIGEGVLKDLKKKKDDENEEEEEERQRQKDKKKRDVGDLMNDY